MSNDIDEKLGRLLQSAENQEGRLDRIEEKLDSKVDIALFKQGIREHAEIRADVKRLEISHAKGEFWAKLRERVVYVITGAVVVALLGLIGL